MNYQDFLNLIKNCFMNILNIFNIILSNLLNNFIFKILFHIVLLIAVIEFTFKILSVIKNIFSRKVSSSKNKTDSNTDIE